MPLTHEGSCVGVLALYASTANAFSEDQLRLLAPSFAASIATVSSAADPHVAAVGTMRQSPGELRLLRR